MEISLEVLIPAGLSPNDGQSGHCAMIKSELIPGAGPDTSSSQHPWRGVESPEERLCCLSWDQDAAAPQSLHHHPVLSTDGLCQDACTQCWWLPRVPKKILLPAEKILLPAPVPSQMSAPKQLPGT